MKTPENWKLNADGSYDVKGNVSSADLKPFVKEGKLTISFNVVDGNFEIIGLELKTLEGCPKKVTGDFICKNCDIETMTFCPTTIERNLDIESCDKLHSLEGCPETIKGMFKCYDCDKLTSLKGMPQSCGRCDIMLDSITTLEYLAPNIKKNLTIRCSNVKNLKGCPATIPGLFMCFCCDNLVSLEGAPEFCESCDIYSCKSLQNLAFLPQVTRNLYIHNCDSLTSLEGCPDVLKGDFMCVYCDKIASLEYAPKECNDCFIALKSIKNLDHLPQIMKDLRIRDCDNLESLQGCSAKVNCYFECSDCDKITSLEFSPKSCGNCYISLKSLKNLDYLPQATEDLRIVWCENLESLKGCPSKVNGDFECSHCDKITSLEYAPKSCGNCSISLKSLKNLDYLPQIKEDLSITDCENLESLKGCPSELNGDFECKDCDKITSLEYAPKICASCLLSLKSLKNLDYLPQINQDLKINNAKNLESLKGCLTEVAGKFECRNCDKITSLEYAPKSCNSLSIALKSLKNLNNLPQIKKDLFIDFCDNLESLAGCPETVKGCFRCWNCDKITSLEYAPKLCWHCVISLKSLKHLENLPQITGDVVFYNCENLESLDGCPDVVDGNFECSYCDKITSLTGAPTKITADFILRGMDLTTLDGFPRIVEEDLCWEFCPYTEEEIEKVCEVQGEINFDEIED